MKCIALFGFVLLLQLYFTLRQYEVRLKYSPKRTADGKAKSDQLKSILENQGKAGNFEDIQSNFTSDLDGIPIPVVTVTLNDFEVNLDSSLSSLETALSDLIQSTSSILASTSNKLSSILKNFTASAESFNEAFSLLSNNLSGALSSIKEILTDLNIGTGMPLAVLDLEETVTEMFRIVNGADRSQLNVTQAFDDAVFSVGTKLQVLVVGISVVADAAASKIATIKEEVKEIVVALTLVLHTVLLIVQSICYSVGSMLSALEAESATMNSLLLLADKALQHITEVVKSITSAVTAKMNLIVGTIGVTLTSLTSKLNASMDKLEARSLLKITDTLGRIVFKLIGSTGNFVSFLSSSVSTITSSLRIVSASDSGIHSKVCRKLYKVYSTLFQLTGTDDEIIASLSKQLPSIYEIIKPLASSLISGLGTDAGGAVVKAVSDIIDSLNRMLPFLNVESGYVKVLNIEFLAKEIAKNVQILTSIVSAIVATVSESINSVIALILECLIALQFLHSTILYVVQWVSALSASFVLAKSSSQNELATSLAVVVVVMLDPVAKAVSMIATALPDSLSYVVKSTSTFFLEVYKTGSEAFSKVSQVETNTKITLEQITGSSGSILVEGFVNETVGTVSQLFNGVTGSLGAISSTLTSSLSSLDSSLKEILSSKSDLLKAVSSILLSITTKISNITGSASGILSATLNSLSTVFGNLFDVISKLSVLGDISISLGSSVSKISVALHSIIDAASDVKGDVYVVNEQVVDVAKSVQIFISTFVAVIKAAGDATVDVFTSASEAIFAVPYLTGCVVVLVQHILGAVIAAVSLAFGGISFSLQKLTISMSSILKRVISITTEVTSLVTVSDGKPAVLTSKIISSVTKLKDISESSMSKITAVTTNMNASLKATNLPNSEL